MSQQFPVLILSNKRGYVTRLGGANVDAIFTTNPDDASRFEGDAEVGRIIRLLQRPHDLEFFAPVSIADAQPFVSPFADKIAIEAVFIPKPPAHPDAVLASWMAGFSIPDQITQMVELEMLDDVSEMNDACPNFIFAGYEPDIDISAIRPDITPAHYRLWVEMPHPSEREGDASRFTLVSVDDTENLNYRETLISTDDVSEIVKAVKNRFFLRPILEGVCPWCAQSNLENTDREFYGVRDTQVVECNSCSRQWVETRQVVDVQAIEQDKG